VTDSQKFNVKTSMRYRPSVSLYHDRLRSQKHNNSVNYRRKTTA